MKLDNSRSQGSCFPLRTTPTTSPHCAKRRPSRAGKPHWRSARPLPAYADPKSCAHRSLRARALGSMPDRSTNSTRATAMTAKMVAVGYAASLPISEERSLFEFETPVPQPGDRDLLVRVARHFRQSRRLQGRACASRGPRPSPSSSDGMRRAPSRRWDATAACSSRATTSITPATSTGPAPTHPSTWSTSASSAASRSRLPSLEAAALPLTTLTAWELLFDRIGVKRGEEADRRSLLIVGGAGGVGSIAIQLARKLTGLSVIATASRPQTRDWVQDLGAHHVIDHSKPFAPQLKAAGFRHRRHRAGARRAPPRNASADHRGDIASGPPRR